MPEKKLPIPYGESLLFQPDGKHLAYIYQNHRNIPFKRYRGANHLMYLIWIRK